MARAVLPAHGKRKNKKGQAGEREEEKQLLPGSRWAECPCQRGQAVPPQAGQGGIRAGGGERDDS